MPATLAANRRARQPGQTGAILSAFVSPCAGIRLEDRGTGCFRTLPGYSGDMSAPVPQFDSHRFVKRLTNAGLSEEVAEILAEEHASRFVPADVATKADVAEAGNATRSDIAAANAEVAATRSDLATTNAEVAKTNAEVAKTRAEIALAVAEVKELIVATQRSTLRWMFGMMLAYTGIILAAMANFR